MALHTCTPEVTAKANARAAVLLGEHIYTPPHHPSVRNSALVIDMSGWVVTRPDTPGPEHSTTAEYAAH
jgi:hypothetical protein